MTGALLGHASHQATSIYAHMQQDPARRAAERVVAPIAAALGLQNAAEVVSFESARALPSAVEHGAELSQARVPQER